MISRFFSRNILILLLGFLSIAALYGSIVFMIKPDGSFFQMDPEMIEGSWFDDFLIPGLILFTLFGIFPILTIICLIRKPDIKWLNYFNLLYDYHFAWTFTVYIGCALIIWINAQTLILSSVEIIHTIYSSFGILIICISLLPSVRLPYRIQGRK